jgi:glycosyltransferase involved in cell wall biosynthesis
VSAPLVSVILPTYRRAHVIARALKSVLAQSYRELEVIILDDVPKDDTEAVVKAFNDPRVRYVAYPDRRGVAAARNQGFDLARGKYLAFQDSDDEWLAEKLAWQVARMEALPEEVGLTQAAVLRFQGLGTEAEYYLSDLPAGQEATAILPCNWTSFTQGWLLRKSVIDAVGGFDDRLPLWEDWELMIRICQKYRLDLDRRPVALVYDTPGGLTAQDRARPAAFRLIMERHRELMQHHPDILAGNLYELARMEIVTAGKAASGRAMLKESVRMNPRSLKAWTLLISAYGGANPPRFIAWARKIVRGWFWALRRRWFMRSDPIKA